MTRRPSIFAVLTLLVLPAWSWADDDNQPAKPAGQASSGQTFADVRPSANGDVTYFADAPRYSAYDVRFGWWASWQTGSPAKSSPYEDFAHSSPFWDVDGMSSDGIRTFAITATGTDNETTDAHAYYYQPGASAKVDYDRFIHQLDHDPLNNMGDINNPAVAAATPQAYPIIKQDLGAGQDYAIRVQEIKASFKADVADGLRVRLDLWGMSKDGVRQVDAVGMCYTQPVATVPPLPPGHPALVPFNGARCHVLSMPQQIDWQTTEIKPVIEARLGDSTTIEYSRPMRGFTADDSSTTRFYDHTFPLTNVPAGNNSPSNAYPFAVVPSNYTQMDQLKVNSKLNDETTAYGYMMIGNTLDEDIDMQRYFNDMDFRLSNTSIKNLSLTAYGSVYNEDESTPTAANAGFTPGATSNTGNPNFENTPPSGQTSFSQELIHPIDYHKTTLGAKSVWRPWGTGFGLGGLAIVSGFEYCDLQRDYALYPYYSPGTNSGPASGLLDDQHTITNSFQIGPDVRWSTHFDTYLHYKYQNADQPLIGINSSAATEPAGALNPGYAFMKNGIFNTLLPTTDNIVEIGFNLMPSEHFIVNASVGIEQSSNHSPYADFSEQNYPFNINAWYSATERFSVSGGYALYSNFVAQNVYLADQNTAATGATPSSAIWSYGGNAQVFTLGWKYQASESVRMTGKVEYVLGHDLINNSTTNVATSANNAVVQTSTTESDFGAYSEVQNRTTRVNLGVDWTIRPRMVVYGRYELVDFLDQEPGYESGTAQGIMGGFSMMF